MGHVCTRQVKTGVIKEWVCMVPRPQQGRSNTSAQISALCHSIVSGESEPETTLESKVLVLELQRASPVLHGDSQGSPVKVP